MLPEKKSRPADNGTAQSVTDGDTHRVHRATDTHYRPRRLRVTFVNRHCVFVAGYGSRELLIQLRGRSPLWSAQSRAWYTTERTARDLIAIAEARGYDVTIGHGDPGEGRW